MHSVAEEHNVQVAPVTVMHRAQLSAPLAPHVPASQSAQVPAAVVDAPARREAEPVT